MEDKIIWVEGNPDIVQRLKIHKKWRVINAIINDKDGQDVIFNLANNGLSSSILEFGTHSQHYPHVKYIGKFQGKTKTVKTMYKEQKIPNNFANFLNIDIQGAELFALKGMNDLLNNFDYLFLEVNEKEVYKNCGLVTEIDEYVKQYGYKRIQTKMTNAGWGDAFYMK